MSGKHTKPKMVVAEKNNNEYDALHLEFSSQLKTVNSKIKDTEGTLKALTTVYQSKINAIEKSQNDTKAVVEAFKKLTASDSITEELARYEKKLETNQTDLEVIIEEYNSKTADSRQILETSNIEKNKLEGKLELIELLRK